MKRTLRTALLALLAMSLVAVPSHAAPHVHAASPDHANVNRTLAQVRAATAKYHDVEAAIADNYLPPDPENPHACVPAMGYHYVRGVAGIHHPELDPLAPEILVYAPHANGELKLVAVEYAHAPNYLDPDLEPHQQAGAAELFGQTFDPIGAGPPFYTLHVWLWHHNPDGMFAAHNPRVSC